MFAMRRGIWRVKGGKGEDRDPRNFWQRYETLHQKKKFGCFQIETLKRNSYRRCSIKKDALKNFAKFTEKHVCWCRLRPKTLLKMRHQHLFFCGFCEFFSGQLFYRTHPGNCFSMGTFMGKYMSRNLFKSNNKHTITWNKCRSSAFALNLNKFTIFVFPNIYILN